MKKFLFLLIFIILVFSLTACQIFENKSLTLKERVEEETLSFKIEKKLYCPKVSNLRILM